MAEYTGKNLIIGITGGVGTGKSTVLDILRDDYGAHIIRADDEGRRVMEKGSDAYMRIVSLFGAEILDSSGDIDRKILGGIVFSDASKLAQLNAVIHPEVKKIITGMIEEIMKKEASCLIYADGEPGSRTCADIWQMMRGSLIVIEAALLIEEGYDAICDELWYVYAEDEVRFKRLCDSRGYTLEQYRNIKANQLSHGGYIKKCRRMIDNGGDIKDTKRQIAEIFMQS